MAGMALATRALLRGAATPPSARRPGCGRRAAAPAVRNGSGQHALRAGRVVGEHSVSGAQGWSSAASARPAQRRLAGACRSADAENAFRIECIDGEGTIQVDVLDALTAQVTVKDTLDRPGLLRDLTNAINKLGLTIENAKVNTKQKTGEVENVFLVKANQGSSINFEDETTSFFDKDGFVCETMLETVKNTIFTEAIASWGVGPGDSLSTEEGYKEIVKPSVDVMKFDRAGHNAMMVRVEATDCHGLLNSITSSLTKLGVHISSAEVSTKYGCISNKFMINAPEDLKMETIRTTTLEAISVAAEEMA